MSAKVDYYEVLGIPQTSTYDDIKKSYHNLVRKHHPDKTDSEIQHTLDKFLLIEEAWKVLGDQQARTLYDAKRILEKSSYVRPVDEELSLKDLVKDPEKGAYKKQCRCGGWFCVSVDDAVQGGLVAVECNDCSLSLVVDCDI